MILQKHAAGNFHALTGHPCAIITEYFGDCRADIGSFPYSALSRYTADKLVHVRVVSYRTASEICGNGTRCDGVYADPAAAQLFCQVPRQYFHTTFHHCIST